MVYKQRHSTANIDICLSDEQTFDLESSTSQFMKCYANVSWNTKTWEGDS